MTMTPMTPPYLFSSITRKVVIIYIIIYNNIYNALQRAVASHALRKINALAVSGVIVIDSGARNINALAVSGVIVIASGGPEI